MGEYIWRDGKNTDLERIMWDPLVKKNSWSIQVDENKIWTKVKEMLFDKYKPFLWGR